MAGFSRNPRSDRSYFRVVSNRTARMNVTTRVPRGGIRL